MDVFIDFGDGTWHELVASESEPWKGGHPRCRAHPELRGKRARLPHQLPPGAEICELCRQGKRAPRPHKPRRTAAVGMIPNAPIRAAFERSGVSVRDLAERMGERRRPNGYIETTRLDRMLGRRPAWRSADGVMRTQANISRENAAKVLRALHLDPVDFGL
jgi:hypothetical protein